MATTVKLDMTSDIAKVLRDFEKVIEKERRLGDAARDAGRKAAHSTRDAGKARQQTFGAGALRELKSFAVGLVGVSTAVATIKKAFAEAAAARQAFATGVEGAAAGRGRLLQLASSPEDAKRILDASAATYGEGRVADRASAQSLTFELASAGALGERRFFSRLAAIEDPAATAQASARIRNAMGAAETGNLQSLAAKGVAAAAPLPGVSASQLLTAMTVPAGVAGQMGLADEDLMAAVGALSGKMAGPDEAATALNRMLVSFQKRGVEGGSISEMVSKVQDLGFATESDAQKWFGRELGKRAFTFLQGPGLAEARETIAAAPEAGLAEQRIALAEADPEIAATIGLRQSRAREALAGRGAGIGRMANEEALAAKRQRLRDMGMPEPAVQAAMWKWEAMDSFGGSWATGVLRSPTVQGVEESFYGSVGSTVPGPMAALHAAARLLISGAETLRGGPTLAAPDEDR